MAIPAGHIITRHGYKTGVITGLILYATGALLFIPGAHLHSFPFFLLCLFIIGCGLTCLETAANPYVTVLGPADTAPQRINLAQSLNGLGWILGPLVGGLLLFSPSPDPSPTAIAIPYAIIGTLVLLIALIFRRTTLPEITTTDPSTPSAATRSNLWRHTHFTLGLIALFLYVAAQTGLNSRLRYHSRDYKVYLPRTILHRNYFHMLSDNRTSPAAADTSPHRSGDSGAASDTAYYPIPDVLPLLHVPMRSHCCQFRNWQRHCKNTKVHSAH